MRARKTSNQGFGGDRTGDGDSAMLTTEDLRAVVLTRADPGVSVFMTTHVAGREVSQDPIRLRKLLDQGADDLLRRGYRRPDVEDLLAPAMVLTRDERFWRHQDHGLALFLAPGAMRWWHVPIELGETVMVGRYFHIKPLLPLLSLRGRDYAEAQERLEQNLGEGNGRATAAASEAVTAAHDGRVDTLFLRQGAALWGRYEENTNRVIAHAEPLPGDEDLLDWAAAETLLKHGQVSVIAEDTLPRVRDAAALLRY
jgi:hypothetical protein